MAETAAAQAAAIAQAIKASGTLIRVEPHDFSRILNKQEAPVIVRARGGFFRTRWYYLTDRKSTRLNSSHANISYAVFCLKKKKINLTRMKERIVCVNFH